MHPHCIFVVGLVVLFSSARIHVEASVAAVSDVFSRARFDSASGASVAATRALRANRDADGDEEERAGLSVPAVEKFKTIFTSSKVTPEQLQSWLAQGKSADTVFTRMHLTKAGSWLFFDAQFSSWVKYVDDLSAKTSNKGMSVVSTLTAQFGDDALYKMIEQAKDIPRMESLAMRLGAEQMQHWVATRKDLDEIFRLFDLDDAVKNALGQYRQFPLDKAGKRIFSNPKFTAWVKYVDEMNVKNPEEPLSMIPTLKKYFRDGELLRMTESAKTVAGSKSIATKVEDGMVQFWLSSRKTPDDVFVELGLSTTTKSRLDDLFVAVWIKYVDAYSVRYPDTKTTMIETFTRNFDDVRVAKMIIAAKAEDATNTLATKLESAQLEMWRGSGKSADDVFELLKLYQTQSDFSHNPLLNTWVSYMNAIVTENPSKAPSLLSTLEARFSDRPLIQILEAAKKFPSMESAATKMQTETIKGVFASKESPEKVFTVIGLGDAQDNLLGIPLFSAWLNYAKVFNKEHPTQQESWAMTLHLNYQFPGIESMIKKGMQDLSTVNLAKMVERAWMKEWLEWWEKSPSNAFSLLHLDEAGQKTFASPKFKLWAKYLNDFNQRYPNERTTMIDAIRANYSDRQLLRIFNAAKQDPSTEKLASNLENAMLDKWLVAKENPASLKWTYDGLPGIDGIIQRYSKKFAAMSGNTP
ncbi:hypothetical protein PHYPSEUDO_014425 [Phytophthora pseudosyringae]|uniref:RxLR effector protein n=1 Tax=Phytophthora pseudosyringae TaxID=221518 RepID=A0A8T1W1X4_9STRA|nr:hypothetical protein PHYPSEUDO_014425 [Phytophthora pseudosyringae]